MPLNLPLPLIHESVTYFKVNMSIFELADFEVDIITIILFKGKS